MKYDINEFGSRLVTLSTGSQGLRAELSIKATLDDKDADTLHMRASDETLDRYDEVIEAGGWQLENYLRNPVIQNAHNYGDIIHTIGKALVTKIEGGALMQTWKFATNANPIAKIARDMYRDGFLNASSVGFMPIEWINGDNKADYRRKYTKTELLEVSAVGIPANPNALALAVKAGCVNKSDLQELFTLLKTLCKDDAGTKSDAGPAGLGTDAGQLMQLTRDVRSLLRI